MPELRFLVEEKRDRLDVLTTWLPRVAVAVAFLSLGSQKFDDHSWVRLFDRMGFGQWFRYFTGAMQMTGAVLVLIPRTFLAGIAMLACTMAGAVAVWILVVHEPFAAPIPGAILLVLLAIGWKGWREGRSPREAAGYPPTAAPRQ